MAMSRLCVVGVALLAQASARSFEWDRYMKEYASAYYKGSMDGEFSDSLKGYGGAQAQKFAHEYSQDRIAQAKKYQNKYQGQSAPATAEKLAAQPVLLAAAHDKHQGRTAPATAEKPAAQDKHQGRSAPATAEKPAAQPVHRASASDPVSEAFAAQRSAAQEAEASIEELRDWDAKLVQDLRDESFSAAVANGIVTEVQTRFLKQRETLQHSFHTAMQALDAKALATAGSSDVEAAEKGAKEAEHLLERLDHKEAHAMRSTLRALQKAGKVKARTLWREARRAARQVYKRGVRGARAQRRAGERERVYEQSALDAEESSEKLLGRAEEAAEHAEGLVEEEFDKAEFHLEAAMHSLRNQSRHAHEARRERLRQARELARRARREAAEAAEERAATARAAPRGEKEASPSAFLARASSQDFGSALIALLACAAMLGAMTALLGLRFCRSGVATEHPLLG